MEGKCCSLLHSVLNSEISSSVTSLVINPGFFSMIQRSCVRAINGNSSQLTKDVRVKSEENVDLFCNFYGIFYSEFVPDGQTVNQIFHKYLEVL
jgi:hypothetical protein